MGCGKPHQPCTPRLWLCLQLWTPSRAGAGGKGGGGIGLRADLGAPLQCSRPPGAVWRGGSTGGSRAEPPGNLPSALQPRVLEGGRVTFCAWLPKFACSLLAWAPGAGEFGRGRTSRGCLARGSAPGPGPLGRWRQRTGFGPGFGPGLRPPGARRCGAARRDPAAGRGGSGPGNAAGAWHLPGGFASEFK